MKYYFGDNQEYSAADVKDALGTLVAAGGIELDLSDSEEYNPSALNQLIGSAVASGFVPEGKKLKLVKDGDIYRISAGRGVFSDGGVVIIEENTAVNVSGGEYVYLAYSAAHGEPWVLTSKTELEDGAEGVYIIPIAYVNRDGTVADKRVYARGKIPALPSATWNVLREEEFVVDTSSITSTAGGYVEISHEIDGDMNFMLYESGIGLSKLEIDGGAAKYKSVYSSGSSNHRRSEEYFCVGTSGHGDYKATYVGSGEGYITLRYHFPLKPVAGEYRYKALVGILSREELK